MMLYPPVGELAEKTGSRYQLVNLIARRARNIAAAAQIQEEVLEDKPVSMAIRRGAGSWCPLAAATAPWRASCSRWRRRIRRSSKRS